MSLTAALAPVNMAAQLLTPARLRGARASAICALPYTLHNFWSYLPENWKLISPLNQSFPITNIVLDDAIQG